MQPRETKIETKHIHKPSHWLDINLTAQWQHVTLIREKPKETVTIKLILDVFPRTVIRLLVFTQSNPSQPGPITRHLVLSTERPVLLVSKISHQQEPLCGMGQRRADRSPELSHCGPQTAEDNRNKLKLCWTVEFVKGYWMLLTMKRP